MKRPRLAAYLLLLGTVLIWGATFSLVKAALRDASPLLFNLLRFGLAAAALIVVNRAHLRGLGFRNLRAAAVAGVFLALGYEFQTFGLAGTEPAKSAFITGLVVIFVPALSLVPSFRSPGSSAPARSTAVGAMLAFCGLLLITTPAGVHAGNLFASIGAGDLLTLVGALAFAAHVLALDRATRRMPAGPLATVQIGFAALIMLALLPLRPEHVSFTPRLLLTLAVCGLFATAAAFTIQSFAQRVLPPTHTVLLLTLEPVFAWATSVLLLHQGLDARSVAGALMILSGIGVVEGFGPARVSEIPA